MFTRATENFFKSRRWSRRCWWQAVRIAFIGSSSAESNWFLAAGNGGVGQSAQVGSNTFAYGSCSCPRRQLPFGRRMLQSCVARGAEMEISTVSMIESAFDNVLALLSLKNWIRRNDMYISIKKMSFPNATRLHELRSMTRKTRIDLFQDAEMYW